MIATVARSLALGVAAVVCLFLAVLGFVVIAGWLGTRRYHGEGAVGWDPVSMVANWTGVSPQVAMKIIVATPFVVFGSAFIFGLIFFARSH
ncbi:MAG TPA: hypothetical protein VMS96_06030 [Terriglobales bacterium]|nr:hypothetical protein [Terriglobales bacterium]